MKFRAPTFQASRDPNEDGFKPTPFKMPTMPLLREKKSKAAMDNGADNGNERPPSRPGTGFLRRKRSRPNLSNDVEHRSEDVPPVPTMGFLKKKMSMPNLGHGADDGRDEAQSPAMKQALRDLLQKTGTNIRETGAKLESRIPQKSKVVCMAHIKLCFVEANGYNRSRPHTSGIVYPSIAAKMFSSGSSRPLKTKRGRRNHLR